jgi:hypothetical protein
MSIGMSKNEAHKLKGVHNKYCPPNYVTKLKKLWLQTRTGKDEFLLDDEANSETVPSPPSTTSGVTMPLPPVMGSLGSPVPASLTDSMDAVINHQGSILILLLQSIFFKSTLENEQDFAPKYYGTYNRKTHYVAKSNCIIYILIDRSPYV